MNIGHLTAGLATDVGLKRRNNQDLGYADHGVYVVCDGMGGGMGGERASARAIDHLRALTALPVRNRADIETVLADAQTDVLALGQELGGVAGTTVTGLILVHGDAPDTDDDDSPTVLSGIGGASGDKTAAADLTETAEDETLLVPFNTENLAYVVNIGDSRTYHMDALEDGSGWDASTLTRITRDHSQRQEAIDSGELLPDVAASLIPRNVITQCIGDPDGIDPDLFLTDATGRFIICSDGLHAEVSGDDEIAAIAARYDDPQQAADALLQASLAAGGRDNVTVIVADMPVLAPKRHAWAVTKLGDEEDIGNIADQTLQTLRTITPRRP
ncbi:PP2C family protein-serine/threonine phosphatase [Bifidobacterium stellenboschense]|uniref:Phosphoprotein phosphatase n=1 Tax=Bifidobacterium stellenboschense TaxID=762211 RepID=A0A087DE30_9BIFI|nr:serine/threonine-protein phosphatase [Bifidobacterium stellenboschense]KFI93780.1 phosphoprotein phosphatase [Bifidobacterium stellenboschense]